MALGSCARWSLCINPPVNPTREQDEFDGQNLAQRFNVGSDKASTKASTSPETFTLPFIPLSTKDLFIKFMKVFMETMQAQT